MIMIIPHLKCIFGYSKITNIDNKLLAGSATFFPIKVARLKRLGVTQVIDLRKDSRKFVKLTQKLEEFYCNLFNIKYKNIGSKFEQDTLPSLDYYSNINSEINQNKGKTFIHCYFGRHRTSQCIAMYQKEKQIPEDKIIKDMLDLGWNEVRDFSQKHYTNIITFVRKFFPSNENIKKVINQRNTVLKK